MNLDERQALKKACKLYGGIRAVSRAAGVGASNLSQWFKGGSTLSTEKVAHVLNAMGLPNGTPDQSIVHDWRMKWSPFDKEREIFQLYFPNGAEVAMTPWWQDVGFNFIRASIVSLASDPEVVQFLYDGQTRAICRNAPIPVRFEVREPFKWRGGDEKKAIINPEIGMNIWLGQTPTITQFDALWSSSLEDKKEDLQSWDLVVQEAQELGWTHEGLLKKIRTEEPE